jgi:hypothetical protein
VEAEEEESEEKEAYEAHEISTSVPLRVSRRQRAVGSPRVHLIVHEGDQFPDLRRVQPKLRLQGRIPLHRGGQHRRLEAKAWVLGRWQVVRYRVHAIRRSDRRLRLAQM